MKKVFLFGGGRILQELLQKLLDSNDFNVVGLHPRQAEDVDIIKFAEERSVSVYESEDINDEKYLSIVSSKKPDLIVSCNEKFIFKEDLINLSSLATVNIHNGVLPLQRGGGSVYSAFVNNQKIGSTIHYLDEGIDSGEIIAQIQRDILPSENSNDVMSWLYEIGPNLYFNALVDIINQNVKPQSQIGQKYSYIPAKPEFDEFINFDEPSILIHRKILARQNSVVNFTYLNGRKLFLLESEVDEDVADYIGTPGQVINKCPRGVTVKTSDTAILLKLVRFQDGEPFIPKIRISTQLGINPFLEIIKLKEKLNLLEKCVFFYDELIQVNRKITLRQLELEDENDVFLYSSTKGFADHLSFTSTPTREDTIKFINSINTEIKNKKRLYWGVEYEGRIVGTIGFMKLNQELSEAELGFGISSDLWGTGVINKCIQKLIRYAFVSFKLKKINVGTVLDNLRCTKFVEKEGFKFSNKTNTHINFSMTRSEFENMEKL